MRQTSLRHKVLLGYYIISALVLSLSLFTLMELRAISQHLMSSEEVFVLQNDVLEMRRFEKNFFLYHKQEDMDQLLSYTAQVKQFLSEAERLSIFHQPGLEPMRAKMDDYAALVTAQGTGTGEQMMEAEKAIRVLGKAIVTAAEAMSMEEQIDIRQSLEQHRLFLLEAMIVVVLVIFLLGRFVSHRIVLPLRRIEESMVGVANGQLTSLHIQSNDREILSLTHAFNLVLQELNKRHKHLLRSEKLAALGTLLSGVAHELNNPLSNISSSCQILSEEVEGDDLAFKRELLAQMDEQTRRARDIVRSLLDFARERTFHKIPVVLVQLIDEVIRFSKGSIPTRIRVRVDIPPDVVLLGDRQRLQQAFINLLKNALDAIPESGEVWIRALSSQTVNHDEESPLFVGCNMRTPWTEVVIQDTGTGIPDDCLARIFDPFFTTKAVGKGSGLGLAVVFEVIEEHEGCIAVESQWGQGTRFYIRLPTLVQKGTAIQNPPASTEV